MSNCLMLVLLAWLKDKLALDMEEELCSRITSRRWRTNWPRAWAGTGQGDDGVTQQELQAGAGGQTGPGHRVGAERQESQAIT